MANYTMEIREMMNQPLIKGVFTFDYSFYSDNPTDKEEFEKLFVNYYYFREIGFETPERFKVKLQAKLNLIMPYYQQLAMTEWDKVKTAEQMMESKNLTETTEHSQQLSGDNTTNSNASGEVTSSQNSSGTSTNNQTSSSQTTSKSSSLADGVSQASLTDGYLTSVQSTDDNATITQTNEDTNEATASSQNQSNQVVTGTNSQQLTETTIFTSKGDVGIQTPAYAIAEWRKVLININKMIIDECEDLFMKIY